MGDHAPSPLTATGASGLIEETLGVGLFSLDIANQQVTLSAGLAGAIGLEASPRAYSINYINSLIHPHDRVDPLCMQAGLERRTPGTCELRVITADGSVRCLSLHSEFLRDSSGRPARVVGLARDITAVRENHGARPPEAHFRERVLGVAPIVWAARPDGFVTEMTGWQNITGMRDSSAHGVDWVECIHADDRNPMLAQWQRSIAAKSVCDSKIRLVQTDGTYRWYRVHGVPQLSKSGGIREWNGIAVDIHALAAQRDAATTSFLTGAQIRASRAILKWAVRDLSEATGVSPAIIRRLEDCDGVVTNAGAASETIRRVLTQAGIDFVFAPNEPAGVRPARLDGSDRR